MQSKEILSLSRSYWCNCSAQVSLRQGVIWEGLELQGCRMTQVERVSCPASCPKQDQPQVSLLNALSGQVLDRMAYQVL